MAVKEGFSNLTERLRFMDTACARCKHYDDAYWDDKLSDEEWAQRSCSVLVAVTKCTLSEDYWPDELKRDDERVMKCSKFEEAKR